MALKFKKGKTMRRLIFIFVIVLVLCVPVHAITYTAFDKATFDNSYQWSGHPTKDRATQWAKDIEALVVAGAQLGPGSKLWYVDSGSGRSASGDGTSWERAFLTGDEAFDSGKATANRGDIVFFAPGHNEALAAAGITVDVAGVRLVGYGSGSLKPTFDYDVNTGTFIINAANVTLTNFRFRTSANAVTKALVLQDAGDNAQILGCEFGYAETVTDEFATALWIDSAANNVVVADCWFNAGGQAAVSAISCGAVSGPRLYRNKILGDYSTGCLINASGVLKTFWSEDNVYFNGTMGGDGEINNVAAVVMLNGSSGLFLNDTFVSGTVTGLTMRTGDDMVFINNMMTATDGDEFSGGIESGSASVTLSEAND